MQSRENITLCAVADAIRNDDEQATHTGEMLARCLNLKKARPASAGRYNTDWGTKTAAGLARTVLSQIEGSRIETAKDREPFVR